MRHQKWTAYVSGITLAVPLVGLLLYYMYYMPHTSQICYQETCFSVELAHTLEQREKGLMYRNFLSSDRGMLFVFTSAQAASFWMQDVQMSLDIIRFDSGLQVIHTVQAPLCTTTICPVYHYTGLASYVLEINAGRIDKLPIQQGQIRDIQGHTIEK